MPGLNITSTAFSNGERIPPRYSFDGDNINPPLQLSGVNPKAKSLVLVVDDPDAATDPDGPGKTFDHWVVFNIKPTITEVKENSQPDGSIVAKNGMGISSYIGPAPPNGEHRYFFKLYELLDTLDLNEQATKTDLEKAMEGKVLSSAQLMGIYQRQ